MSPSVYQKYRSTEHLDGKLAYLCLINELLPQNTQKSQGQSPYHLYTTKANLSTTFAFHASNVQITGITNRSGMRESIIHLEE